MTARVTSVGTQTSADYLTHAEYNDAAGGWVQRLEVTADDGGIVSGAGTPTDLTNLEMAAWSVPAGREYEFSFSLAFSNTNVDEQVSVYLIQDGAILNKWDFPIGGGVANATSSVSDSMFYEPTTASHVYKLGAGRSGSGSGTFTMRASSTRRAQFRIKDVGPR